MGPLLDDHNNTAPLVEIEGGSSNSIVLDFTAGQRSNERTGSFTYGSAPTGDTYLQTLLDRCFKATLPPKLVIAIQLVSTLACGIATYPFYPGSVSGRLCLPGYDEKYDALYRFASVGGVMSLNFILNTYFTIDTICTAAIRTPVQSVLQKHGDLHTPRDIHITKRVNLAGLLFSLFSAIPFFMLSLTEDKQPLGVAICTLLTYTVLHFTGSRFLIEMARSSSQEATGPRNQLLEKITRLDIQRNERALAELVTHKNKVTAIRSLLGSAPRNVDHFQQNKLKRTQRLLNVALSGCMVTALVGYFCETSVGAQKISKVEGTLGAIAGTLCFIPFAGLVAHVVNDTSRQLAEIAQSLSLPRVCHTMSATQNMLLSCGLLTLGVLGAGSASVALHLNNEYEPKLNTPEVVIPAIFGTALFNLYAIMNLLFAKLNEHQRRHDADLDTKLSATENHEKLKEFVTNASDSVIQRLVNQEEVTAMVARTI